MIKELQKYRNEIYPFHMPGHKLGRRMPLGEFNPYEIDVTEVEGTDNLQNPQGIIKDAQNRTRRLYGSIEAYFLVNGSSGGILAAIGACCKQDGKVLMARNCHKSVYNSLVINRLEPIYIMPEYIEEYGLLGGISPNEVGKQLEAHPDISCVIITSPTYEGFTLNVAKIAEIVHEHHKVLIVDEAHGAHFKLYPLFPKSALDCGADIVIHSLHKTLPAFTQSAVLHVNSDRVDTEKIREYLNIYQTTSPSYILMSGIDQCMTYLESKKDGLFSEFIGLVDDFRRNMKNNNSIKLIGEEIKGRHHIFDIDLSRLTFVGKDKALNGKAIERMLRKEYNIQVEMSMLGSIIAISTISDQKDAFDKLWHALDEIASKSDCISSSRFDIMSLPIKIETPFQALQKEKTQVFIQEAEDRICGQFVTLYPPGIPILVPGERIEKVAVMEMKTYLKNGFSLQGIEVEKIQVIK